MTAKRLPILYAIIAAVCYGVSVPAAKALLGAVPPTYLAALLYLGAGFGMLAVRVFGGRNRAQKEAGITFQELPFTAAMVALDIAAPIFLMIGLSMTSPAAASLLNNFEIVATTVVALAFFKEAIGRQMWLAIALITAACVLLTVEDFGSLSFSPGSLLVLLACVCWGIENNCTTRLSLKDPLQIVIIKGIFSGLGSLCIALFIGDVSASAVHIAAALLLGFVAYGLSIFFYIHAQRSLGAARTSAFYAFAPFVGVGLSLAVFREMPAPSFWVALIVMIAGAYLAASEKHKHLHKHAAMEHEHRHNHMDGHHIPTQSPPPVDDHSHVHIHPEMTHSHDHTPDLHHSHNHKEERDF